MHSQSITVFFLVAVVLLVDFSLLIRHFHHFPQRANNFGTRQWNHELIGFFFSRLRAGPLGGAVAGAASGHRRQLEGRKGLDMFLSFC